MKIKRECFHENKFLSLLVGFNFWGRRRKKRVGEKQKFSTENKEK